MRAFVITIEGHAYSEAVSKRCIDSAECFGVAVERFDAVKPDQVNRLAAQHRLTWTWANGNTEHSRCSRTGLKQHPYGRLGPKFACALSHYRLWKRCVELNEPILILEHDAVFIDELPEFEFQGICQINDPAGATPKGLWWHSLMRSRGSGVFPKTPMFADDIPDGLAGNSAYVIKPPAAAALIDAYHTLGVWPNDATMCRQLFPFLEERYPWVTRVEQSQSTSS